MNQKKAVVKQESRTGSTSTSTRSNSRSKAFSSEFSHHFPPFYPPIHQKGHLQQPQIQSQSNPKTQPTHLQIQGPLLSPNPPLRSHQKSHHQFQHEQSSSHLQKLLISTPIKRPTTMAQSPPPPSLCHSLNQSSSTPKFASFPIKTLAFKLFLHLKHARLLCVHLKVLIFISLPSLYLFISNPHRFFILSVFFIIAFSITLLISLNIAIPRLTPIRSLLARSLRNKFNSTPLPIKAAKPVVWSIGSKPKTEKKLYSGSLVKVYSNGDVYEGEFHRGKCSGSGVYYYCLSGRYEGDWVDEKYDGYGVETWAKGSRYRGQYRQGLRHGIGIYRFFTGDVYAGEWSNGQCHGCGIHTCEDGSKYVGEFKWGVKHGLGYYHFRNGDHYAGEYFADKMHGFGVYRFANAHQYEGAWHEGRRQGLGMYTFRNGETQSGHWQNGVLDGPSASNCQPGSPSAASHSKVLNAVQEAQRAAGKAYLVGKIEERVNKSVAAANKAANAARVAAVKAVQKQMHDRHCEDAPTPFTAP